MKPRRVWRSSEAIAASVLEELGFNIVEFHRRVIVEGLDVGEVDIVVERGGVYYAVEVKAGLADVSSIRQAYVNALLLSMKPMVISRGIDEKALKLAEELKVEIITLPDLLIASVDELRDVVREAISSVVNEVVSILGSCNNISDEDYIVIEAIAGTSTFKDAADRLGFDVRELASRISKLRSKGLFYDSKDYRSLRFQAMLMLLCRALMGKNKL